VDALRLSTLRNLPSPETAMQTQALIVADHVKALAPKMGQLTDLFFDYLFAIDPETKAIFLEDAVARRTKFVAMFSTFTTLKHFETIRPALIELGKRHLAYGVKDHYYGHGKKAILLALAAEGSLSAERESAWRQMLDQTISAMLEGARERKRGMTAEELAASEMNRGERLAPDPGLLEAVGGGDGMYAIHLKFYEKLFEEPWLGRFFWGKHETVLARKQTEFMVGCMGGPNRYQGESPAIAHLGMFITDEMLDVRETILRQTLAESGLNPDMQERWLRIDNAFRAAIVKSDVSECVMRGIGQRPIVAKKPEGYRPPKP